MKRFTFSRVLFVAAMAFFFAACGGGSGNENETTTDTMTNTTADTTTPVMAPVNTIVTAPQDMLVVMHKVADYAKWKPGYDADDSARLANGLHNYVITRGLFDTNMVMVAMKADDISKAKAFAGNADLKKAMKKAGVMGTPMIYFVTDTWQDTADIGPLPRTMVSLTVKDWDTWLKNFQNGKQEREDNGIITRVIGHDVDNDKKVHLVTALSDTAKAFAYYKSDALKKRIEEGGVIGEPKRFIFRVVERY